MNVIEIATNVISWIIIIIISLKIYRAQVVKPVRWKMFLVLFIGLFSFSFHFSFMETQIKLAILPLGVWLIYGLYSKQNGGESWNRYRKYAWLGFFSNFIFLMALISSALLHEAIYPKDEPSTYFGDYSHAAILTTHPSAKKAELDLPALTSQMNGMQRSEFYPDEWNQFDPINNRAERFPYYLTGIRARWGSGIISQIFVEQNGKGLLITTPNEQYYFQANMSFLREK